jgi:hypothetical protein
MLRQDTSVCVTSGVEFRGRLTRNTGWITTFTSRHCTSPRMSRASNTTTCLHRLSAVCCLLTLEEASVCIDSKRVMRIGTDLVITAVPQCLPRACSRSINLPHTCVCTFSHVRTPGRTYKRNHNHIHTHTHSHHGHEHTLTRTHTHTPWVCMNRGVVAPHKYSSLTWLSLACNERWRAGVAAQDPRASWLLQPP